MVKIGDVVALKSGGCLMTVTRVRKYRPQEEDEEVVDCVWQVGAELKQASFGIELLQVWTKMVEFIKP